MLWTVLWGFPGVLSLLTFFFDHRIKCLASLAPVVVLVCCLVLWVVGCLACLGLVLAVAQVKLVCFFFPGSALWGVWWRGPVVFELLWWKCWVVVSVWFLMLETLVLLSLCC